VIPVLAGVGWLVAVVGWVALLVARAAGGRRAAAVARACHELRGPLTAARLGLEPGGRERVLSVARSRAIGLELARAALAVEDLARAAGSRRQRGWVRLEAAVAIDVAGLLAASVEAWRGMAAAHGVELRLSGGSEAPVVYGSTLRLAQATGNLIANAIEHARECVQVGWRADRCTVRIEVLDDGEGLPAPVAALIADHAGAPARAATGGRRRRATARWGRRPAGGWRRRETGGWRRRPTPTARHLRARSASLRGHGLAVVAEVAVAHGGRLAAAPAERGARLVLELPRGRATALRRPAA